MLRPICAQYDDIVIVSEPGRGMVEPPNVFSDIETPRVDKPRVIPEDFEVLLLFVNGRPTSSRDSTVSG